MFRKSPADTYLMVQESLGDLLSDSNRSLSLLYIRMNELCEGCERLFHWADDKSTQRQRQLREIMLGKLVDGAEDSKSKGLVSKDFQTFLQKSLLVELNALKADLLADALAS